MFNEMIFIQEIQSLECNAIELLDRILEIEFKIMNDDSVSKELLRELGEYTNEYDLTNERLAYLNSIIGMELLIND